jgi:cystathionine beta-lyase
MVDNVYGPARRLCENELKKFGIETTYYDPNIGAGIASLIKSNTRVIYVESPGSLTFEVQDVPAIVKAAHAKGVTVIADDTWATQMFSKAFEMGVDVSVHSATKYVSGHSDLIMGIISCQEKDYEPILRTYRDTGACASADNAYLALRGLRTMGVRLKQHQESALIIAQWLRDHKEVEEVLYPALPGAPGHDLWKRDFTGACGLFAFVLKEKPSHEALAAMLDNMELFGMGYSWGGYESLITPVSLKSVRTATKLPYTGQLIRVHIGLEHVDDLIHDLDEGLKRLRKAA